MTFMGAPHPLSRRATPAEQARRLRILALSSRVLYIERGSGLTNDFIPTSKFEPFATVGKSSESSLKASLVCNATSEIEREP